jgi:pimeloyl-ACP methyl ester carboxylesterase
MLRALLALLFVIGVGSTPLAGDIADFLGPRHDSVTGEVVLYGLFPVYEKRAEGEGRKIALEVLVLPAKSEKPQPDPIFYLAGGPGVNAISARSVFRDTIWRQDRDIVFISQRGTGGTVRLDCDLPGGDDDLAGYLDPAFDPESLRDCLRKLELQADLRMYSTPTAMDDINEIRAALGYGQINLMGGSYGTRAALVYMRRHPETVRCAVLNGVAPLRFTNPLYHAWGAQVAIERLFAECEDDDACNAAFPDLGGKLEAVLNRLEAEPAAVTVRHPATGEEVAATLGREGFAEGLRVMMYRSNRSVPLHIQRAYEGDVGAFAQAAMEADRSVRDIIAFGMLMCVTCSEDVARIDSELVGPLTEGTFAGPGRVLRQMEACELWPRSDLPEGFAEPVVVDVPVLILSGSLDPVTPPEWGELLAAQLPHSRHLIVPGAHGVMGPCVNGIVQELLESGSVADLDTSCVRRMGLGPFVIEQSAGQAHAAIDL